MIRFIVTSFERLMVVALWLMFIGAGAYGYASNGATGALIGLGASFVFSVLFIAPVMIVSDIRKTLVSIEARLGAAVSARAIDKTPTGPVLSPGPRSTPDEPRVSLRPIQPKDDTPYPVTVDRPDTGQKPAGPRKVLRAEK